MSNLGNLLLCFLVKFVSWLYNSNSPVSLFLCGNPVFIERAITKESALNSGRISSSLPFLRSEMRSEEQLRVVEGQLCNFRLSNAFRLGCIKIIGDKSCYMQSEWSNQWSKHKKYQLSFSVSCLFGSSACKNGLLALSSSDKSLESVNFFVKMFTWWAIDSSRSL